MNEAYTVAGVTITPQAGGYYELTHPTLDAAERVRGKEKADQRAEEIAAGAGLSHEGHMEQQPDLDQVLNPAAEPDDRVSNLEALVAAQNAKIEALLNLVATTVNVSPGDVSYGDPLAVMPKQYRGQVTEQQRAVARNLGIEYITIQLEDVPEIPPTGLYLGHNGTGYMISPGEPVDVPDFLCEVLDHAIMSSAIIDNKTQKVLGYRDRMRYPYHRVT